jgi:hypothetical protein
MPKVSKERKVKKSEIAPPQDNTPVETDKVINVPVAPKENNEEKKVLSSYRGVKVDRISGPKIMNGRMYVDIFTATESYRITEAEYEQLLK